MSKHDKSEPTPWYATFDIRDGTEEFKDYWRTLNHLADYITRNYGPRCSESYGGCGCCQAWAVYDLARAVFMEPESCSYRDHRIGK